MRTTLLFLAFTLMSGVAFSTTVKIINTGFVFTPAEISINVGDTVVFELGSIHNAVEVSETTWLANGNTPLPGFAVDFGGGQVTGLAVGVHYYVCAPHASGGMKGKITVNSSTGIDSPDDGEKLFSVYPVPSTGKIFLQLQNTEVFNNGPDADLTLDVYNLVGRKITTITAFDARALNEIDLTALPKGIYFVKIYDHRHSFTQKIVLE